MEKNIITVNAPLDPSSQGEDDAVSIDMGTGPADQSKVVLDPSKSPLVLKPGETPPPEPPDTKAKGAPQQAAPVGVMVVPRQKGEPLVAPLPKAQQVRQLRTAAKPQSDEDKALAAFVKSLGVEPGEVGLEESDEPTPAMVEAKARHEALTAPQASTGSAMLERATKRALHCLNTLPVGVELTISGDSLGPDGVEFVMGLGFLMGQGVAVCRDGIHYTMKRAG